MKTQLYKKETLLNDLAETFQATAETFAKIDSKKACLAVGSKWSIAQQFKHLILSTFPVAAALKAPYERLAALGKPTDSSLDYEGLKSNYYAILANGAKAIDPFIPETIGQEDLENMLSNWINIGQKFKDRLAKWPEEDLDKYVIPHPILGALSVRQMLFFTILHNKHHLDRIKGEITSIE